MADPSGRGQKCSWRSRALLTLRGTRRWSSLTPLTLEVPQPQGAGLEHLLLLLGLAEGPLLLVRTAGGRGGRWAATPSGRLASAMGTESCTSRSSCSERLVLGVTELVNSEGETGGGGQGQGSRRPLSCLQVSTRHQPWVPCLATRGGGRLRTAYFLGGCRTEIQHRESSEHVQEASRHKEREQQLAGVPWGPWPEEGQDRTPEPPLTGLAPRSGVPHCTPPVQRIQEPGPTPTGQQHLFSL